MSTSYFWRYTACDCCKRFEQIHVGSSANGWTFTFRGWRQEDDGNPFGVDIASRVHWRSIFELFPGDLFDEYGRFVGNPFQWIDELTVPTPEIIEKEALWSGGWGSSIERDPEGFRLDYKDFS